MRLWHYKLIPFLPKSQLIAQWRELNSIFKKQDNHILINYVYEYPKGDLYNYTCIVLKEMKLRKINVKNIFKYQEYFSRENIIPYHKTDDAPFPKHHTDRYLLQCFYNLQEKYDRGQKDFSTEQYEKIEFKVKYYLERIKL